MALEKTDKLKLMSSKLMILSLVFGGVVSATASVSWSRDQEEIDRLQGFKDQQEANARFNGERKAGLGEYKKDKAQYEKDMEALRLEAVKNRKKEQTDKETGNDWKEYLSDRKIYRNAREDLRTEEVENDRKNLAKKKKTIGLTEEEELGLAGQIDRVDPKHRHLLAGSNKPGFGGSSGFGSGSTGSSPSSPPPPNTGFAPRPYTPPPSNSWDSGASSEDFPPPPPEMFDDVPPPPPPPAPMDEFEGPPGGIPDDGF